MPNPQPKTKAPCRFRQGPWAALSASSPSLSIGKAAWSAAVRCPESRFHLSKPPDKKPWRAKGRPPPKTDADFAALRRLEREQRDRVLGPLPAKDDDAPLRLYGLHAVEAALRNPLRRALRLVATENAERRLVEAIGSLSLSVDRAIPRDLDKLLGADAVHQGVMLEAEELPEPEFATLYENANGRPLIVLDQVTDPHNVGAILRSAAVFGAAGLVMTRRHSPPLNGALAKSASGALELVPVALVQNLSHALEELKGVGFTLVGLDSDAEDRLETLDWSRPTAIVMGAEGKGLRELTQNTCDRLARITTDGPLQSLNVSNAAAIALHTAAIARLK